KDKIFVAHNVNFDYSFVKHQLDQLGFALQSKKLCTVRAARQVLPGHSSYSLGKITHALGIPHSDKHRAGGDAKATATLLHLILENDQSEYVNYMLHGRNKEQYLPPHVPTDNINELPQEPGVYYFHNVKNAIIYIGKAINIRKRVRSHFSNNKTHLQKQQFLKEIHKISYQLCATELIASVWESSEIREKWPLYNRSQKGYQPKFGLITYTDRLNRKRFAVDKIDKSGTPLYTFNTLVEGHQLLRQMIEKFKICPALCGMCQSGVCANYMDSPCAEKCTGISISAHNNKIKKATKWLLKNLPTFVLVDKGRHPYEQSAILVENGHIKGIGYYETEIRL